MLFSQVKANAKPLTELPATDRTLGCMISSSGRIGLNVLQRMAMATPVDDFIRWVHQPVLAGSGIRLGQTASQTSHGPRPMNHTILFEPAADGEDAVAASESLKLAVYPLIKGDYATSRAGVFAIGRIDGNDFIMPDYAISRKHALIETRRGGYIVKDLGSTNGTRLNGAHLQNKPVEIRDRDIISFARFEFSFLCPASLYDMLRQA